MSRLTQAVILLLFGGAILRASLTDLFLRYVKQGLRPFLIAAGLLLIAAAVMTLWQSLRAGEVGADHDHDKKPEPGHDNPPAGVNAGLPAEVSAGLPAGVNAGLPAGVSAGLPAVVGAGLPAGPGADVAAGHSTAVPVGREAVTAGGGAGHGHDHGDGHGHHEPRVGWLLILPVLGLLLVAPPALGSFAAGQAGSVAAAPTSGSDYPPLPSGDPVTVGLLDYASRALFDDGKSLTGRDLKLSGFITPAPDGSPMLARIVLTCCAADGRPIKVGMTGKVPLEVPADTWIEVTGAYTATRGKDPVNKVDVAYVEVKSWQEIPEPKQPYT